MVYYFQEISGLHTSGYNLPNFDDIRRDVGFKNIIRLPLPGEDTNKERLEIRKEALSEFAPADKVEALTQNQDQIWKVIVLLHEIIGHGSGTYDPAKYGPKEDPISALGEVGGSALEEQRADLAALVFAGDARLADVGIYENAEKAKETQRLMYDYYVADFLRRTSRERNFSALS